MGILERAKEEIESWKTSRFIENTIYLLLAFWTSTLTHETFHLVTALLLGCHAGMDAGLLMGVTSFECVPSSPYKSIVIALAGGIGSALIGMILWWLEKKEVFEPGELSGFRLRAIILFLLSSIFQLYPLLHGGDMYQAIQIYGLNPIVGWAIWLLLCGIVANIVVSEK